MLPTLSFFQVTNKIYCNGYKENFIYTVFTLEQLLNDCISVIATVCIYRPFKTDIFLYLTKIINKPMMGKYYQFDMT